MKTFIRKILWKFGYDLQKTENSGGSARLAYDLAQITQPTILLDVGANEGQSALEYLDFFPNSKIISFEPLSSAHLIMSQKSKAYPSWTVYPRTAIGDVPGSTEINISNNSVSSSLFEMRAAHTAVSPSSITTSKERTSIIRLDDAMEEYSKNERYFLKIDTQGFELNVLRGAEKILDQVVAIQVELSWTELYAGQPLALEVMQWLIDKGFHPLGFAPGLREKSRNSLLQMDGFFIKRIIALEELVGNTIG